MKKQGFTLAETLITLVIIGVVAALTVPNMLQQYKRQEASARLKKFYSTIQQASIKAKADGNPWEDWANSNASTTDNTNTTVKSFLDKYLLHYISTYSTEYTNAEVVSSFNDGSYFSLYKGQCLSFGFDVNGKKKPNAWGKDIFHFLYCPTSATNWVKTGTLIPFQEKKVITREDALSSCISSAPNCTALLMMDGWEFKKDYPYRL